MLSTGIPNILPKKNDYVVKSYQSDLTKIYEWIVGHVL